MKWRQLVPTSTMARLSCTSLIFICFVGLGALLYNAPASSKTSAARFVSLPTLIKPIGAPATLPNLAFNIADGCSPVFSPRQLDLHFNKHHAAYVDKFNSLASNRFDGLSFQEIVTNLALEKHSKSFEKVLYNQAAQHFNHAFFWKCIQPEGAGMTALFASVLDASFGSVSKFKEKFEGDALSNFGSGWTWLTFDPQSALLQVESTSNADTPITAGRIPLLTVDVWEHSYYKDFENRRAEYLRNFWRITNWNFVEEEYNRVKSFLVEK